MLPLDSGPKLAVGQGNFVCCLIIVVIFLGLGRTYRLGGDFKVVIRVVSHKEMGPFLWGKLTSWNTIKNLNLVIEGGLGWMKWLKKGVEKGFIFHTIIPALYPFRWKFYCLKNFYIQYAWILTITITNLILVTLSTVI